MRSSFIETDNPAVARREAPWACGIFRCQGGFWAFGDATDANRWEADLGPDDDATDYASSDFDYLDESLVADHQREIETMSSGFDLVEEDVRTGAYGISRCEAILTHPDHGRVVFVQGFGGMDEVRGGTYRWEHGFAAKIEDGDTLASLHAASTAPNHIDPYGLDALLDWGPEVLEAIADSLDI